MKEEELYPEAKHITYLSPEEVGEDIHIVKEVTYEHGVYKDNIKIIKDYKRPFYVTKPIYRNHVDKKESEQRSRVDKFISTESKLYDNISRRIGETYMGTPNERLIKRNPYLYGVEVDSRTYLKHDYMERNNNVMSTSRIGVFDIEYDMLQSKMIILSIATNKKIKITLLKSFADTISKDGGELERILQNQYNKYIPDNKFKHGMAREVLVFDTEVDMIKYTFYEANYMKIDTLVAWNISYDITTILDILEFNNIDPADIFHYDKIPEKYKFFEFKEGRAVKKTEAGREIGLSPEERWHTIRSTANYQLLDNMGAHRQIRTGGPTVPGGYSLDNILEAEGVAKKLTFDTNKGLKGYEWHIDMVKNHPAEYITYNEWDDISVLCMDDKTKDLSVTMPVLAGVSHVDIFNSGPRRIVDALTFFYKTKGLVLGVKAPGGKNDKILGLSGWVVTLKSFMTIDNGIDVLKEVSDIVTLVKSYVYDLDQKSGYPSNTMAANVSKDTTHREIVDIEGLAKDLFMLQNINLMFGKANSLEYSQQMFNLPSLFTLVKEIKNEDIAA